ncbi:MAG: FAD-dependent oxidoreductase [Candidatus Pristimantibacillus lignocellulolyticus]|uniref:FAD-dependent oxidoreductase n=1 Tax=Candidatus Pristimantibacillus lignocellulolyticus TaxID=2994561 RepID=A0A9J6ZJG2_9BACL|nr:MAG: FAD-dependent oxidoreductase [Candidatus Pristimantibacillus lignocellulolyticus]
MKIKINKPINLCCSSNVNVATSCCDTSEETSPHKDLPILIVGGGPIGLAAAAQLTVRQQNFILIEAGNTIAHNVETWRHVQLFSPWKYNLDEAAKILLQEMNWNEPLEDEVPTGSQLIEQYLTPLSQHNRISPYIQTNSTVISIARMDNDRMKSMERTVQPFEVYVENNGKISSVVARAVIDASGTWGNPNPAKSNGVWLPSEKQLLDDIEYGIPNIAKEKSLYAGRKIAVIGSGHSAINSLIQLCEVIKEYPDTVIYWLIRKEKVEHAYGGEEKDELMERGNLGKQIHELIDSGKVEVVNPFFVNQIERSEKIMIHGTWKDEVAILSGFDRVIVNTGSRPDYTMNSELRIAIDAATESVSSLANLIDPNMHSCGTVPAHGEQLLRHPEDNFYIVGSKSYGRAPTFLMATGYEQVRSITAYLCGDIEGSQQLQLELPATGVCCLNP